MRIALLTANPSPEAKQKRPVEKKGHTRSHSPRQTGRRMPREGNEMARQAVSNRENTFVEMIADWLQIVGDIGRNGEGYGRTSPVYRGGDPTWGEAR